jgi:hypothetical protein
MATFISVRLPKEWFNSTLDINVNVTAFVTIVDDSWDVRVHTITCPGYWGFHFLPEYKQQVYELIEHTCINKYLDDKLKYSELEYDCHD